MNPVVSISLLGAYVALLGLAFWLSVRWAARRRRERTDAIRRGLQAVGGRPIGEESDGGLYGSTRQEAELGGHRVVASTQPVSRYVYRAGLRVNTPALPWVVIYPEGGVERFGKALGLNREVQTGDQGFDDAAYIDTIEQDAPVQQVLASVEVRDALREILRLGHKVQMSAEGLEAFQLVPIGQLPSTGHFAELSSLLGRVASALPVIDATTFKGKNPGALGRAVVPVLSWVLLLVGAGLLDMTFGSPGARTLSDGNKVPILALAAVATWMVYVLGSALVVRGRPWAFRALLFLGGFGLLGAPILGIVGVLGLNQRLDRSEPTAHTVVVTGKHAYRSERWLHVDSWQTPGQRDQLPVHRKMYDQIETGRTLTVKVHPGALGMPWFEPLSSESL